MRRRPGSAERVVFPVPDRPNMMAGSSRGPMLLEQCMDRCPASGSRKFITVKMDFLTIPQ